MGAALAPGSPARRGRVSPRNSYLLHQPQMVATWLRCPLASSRNRYGCHDGETAWGLVSPLARAPAKVLATAPSWMPSGTWASCRSAGSSSATPCRPSRDSSPTRSISSPTASWWAAGSVPTAWRRSPRRFRWPSWPWRWGFWWAPARAIASRFCWDSANHGAGSQAGTRGVAALGVLNTVAMMLIYPPLGVMQAMQPLVGFNKGAGRMDRVRAIFVRVLLATVTMGAVFSVLGIRARSEAPFRNRWPAREGRFSWRWPTNRPA